MSWFTVFISVLAICRLCDGCCVEPIPNPKKCKSTYAMEKLTDEKKAEYMEELYEMGWEMVTINGEEAVKKVFIFQGFEEAFSFMTNVALQAEFACHFPDWRNVYNKVEVVLTSRQAGGLTVNDVTMAHYVNNVAEISLGAESPYREFKVAKLDRQPQ